MKAISRELEGSRMLDIMPVEMIYEVLEKLTYPDAIRLSQTDKRLEAVIKNSGKAFPKLQVEHVEIYDLQNESRVKFLFLDFSQKFEILALLGPG